MIKYSSCGLSPESLKYQVNNIQIDKIVEILQLIISYQFGNTTMNLTQY